MPDPTDRSAMVDADRPVDDSLSWSAVMAVEHRVVDADAVEAKREEHVEFVEMDAESLHLDLASQEQAESNGDSPDDAPEDQTVAPSSDRAAELESEHWRERAVVWRERAMAAELVAKMLQRNLDDLRANVEDLRRKVEIATAGHARRSAIGSSEPPWRRFVRDMYDKYLG
jgi:hypothetical protein